MALKVGIITVEDNKDGEKVMVMNFGQPIQKPKFNQGDVEYLMKALPIVLEQMK